MTGAEILALIVLCTAGWRSADVMAAFVVAVVYGPMVWALWRWCGK